jgi:alkylation response protein AidB-like acyl-CoA dehydrogenase
MQQDWGERARTAAATLARHAADVDAEGRWPAESLGTVRDAGLLGFTAARDWGGAGAGPTAVLPVIRTLAEACASTAMIVMMHYCGTALIAQAEGFAERDAVMRSIAAGEHLTTLAFSERGSRGHFWAPVGAARDEGDTHRLDAEKSWVTSAGHADSYVTSAGRPDLGEITSSTLYYLPSGTEGLSVSGAWNGLGLRGNASSPMSLVDVRLPSGYRLTVDGGGFGAMLGVVMPWFSLCNAGVSLGLASAATQATRGHLTHSRLTHLDQSLASLMNLRARLAQMQIAVDTQAAFLAHVAQQIESPGPATMLAVLEAKAGANEAALQVTDLAMKSCGGAAFSRHLGVERFFRDARAGYVMAPTADVLYDFIGKALLDLPLF